MMTVAQKAAFELVALDGPASRLHRFVRDGGRAGRGNRSYRRVWTANALLLFGGWESASRGAGATLQMVGERLGIAEQFQGVDQHHGPRRRQLRGSGAGGRRQASGFGLRGSARRAGLGHRQSCPSRATTRRSEWPTCATSCRRCRRAKPAPVTPNGPALRLGKPAETAARNAHREEYAGRRYRARNRRLDWGEITMESILLLAHVEADGTLAKPALEALSAAPGAGRAS